jgi:hypothetical protein
MADKWDRIQEGGPDTTADRTGIGQDQIKHYGDHDKPVSPDTESNPEKLPVEEEPL